MNFIEFRNSFIEVGCVATNQISAQYPDFNANNLTRWTRQGLLVKLRQAWCGYVMHVMAKVLLRYLAKRVKSFWRRVQGGTFFQKGSSLAAADPLPQSRGL